MSNKEKIIKKLVERKELLKEVEHELNSLNGLYCTDKKDEITENHFRLDYTDLIEKLNLNYCGNQKNIIYVVKCKFFEDEFDVVFISKSKTNACDKVRELLNINPDLDYIVVSFSSENGVDYVFEDTIWS